MGSVQATLQLARGGITRDVTSSSKQGAASHLRLVLKRLALLSLGLLLLLLLLLLRRRQRNGDGSNGEGAAGLFVSNTKVAGEVEGGHDVDRLGATATAQVTLLPFRHLVVLCASPVSQRQRRHDLRHHLHEDAAVAAKEMAHFSMELRFIIGGQGLSNAQLQSVHDEDATHGDLLLLSHVQDSDTALSYPNVFREDAVSATTHKSLESIRWAVRTFRFLFLFRIGDDSWLRVHRFMRIAHSIPTKRLYMGRFLFNESVPVAVGWGPQGQHTNYSNTLLNSFGSPVVPAFAWGMGFALSHDVAYFLNEAAAIGQLRLHYPEDQVVATWLYGLVLERLNDERFHDVEVAYLAPEYASTQYWTAQLGISSPCTSDSLLLHHVDWSNLPPCN